MTKDLTHGSPMKLIIAFASSTLIGFLFQQLYNMVDTMIVGRMLGVEALAGVGATGSVNFLTLGLCIGICSGFAIPIAQRFGAGDHKELHRFAANAAYLCIALAAMMTILMTTLCRQILVLMRTPDNIMDYSYRYIFIIYCGIPASILYNMVSGIIRSLGDSKTPVVFLICSSILNVILDIVMIPIMGVGGAALATVLSQAAAGVVSFFFLLKHYPVLHMTKEEARISGRHIGRLLHMGLPMGLQYSITAIGTVVLSAAINTLGSNAVAAVTAGQKIHMFLGTPFDAMGATMATYAGQNIGAGRLDRVRKGERDCILLGFIYSFIAIFLTYVFGRQVLTLFITAKEAAIIETAYNWSTFIILFYFPLALVNIVRFTIQGLGYSILAVVAGVCEMIARSFVGFVLVPIMGFTAVKMAHPAAWVSASAFLLIAYACIVRKLGKKMPVPQSGEPV